MRNHKKVVISFILLSLLLAIILYSPTPWDSPPSLYFKIHTDRTEYRIGEDINITIIIKNIWYKPIKIAHPSILGRTLHFEILTPEGYRLRYKGLYVTTLEISTILNPNEEFTKTINLLDPLYIWGNDSITYNFSTEGIYFIGAIYISGINYCWERDVWEGKLYSNIIHFELKADGDNINKLIGSFRTSPTNLNAVNILSGNTSRYIYTPLSPNYRHYTSNGGDNP